MGGRPPKPLALVQAQGTFENSRQGDRLDNNIELPSLAGTTPVPESLIGKDIAVKYWNEICRVVSMVKGWVTEADYTLIERYCFMQHQYFELRDEPPSIQVDTERGVTIANNPNYKAAEKLRADLLKIEMTVGLTPSSRGKIHVSMNVKDDKKDEFSDFGL